MEGPTVAEQLLDAEAADQLVSGFRNVLNGVQDREIEAEQLAGLRIDSTRDLSTRSSCQVN